MKYRIRCDLSFVDQSRAEDVMSEIRRRFPEAQTINPGTDYAEHSFYDYHECHHDNQPVSDCAITEAKISP